MPKSDAEKAIAKMKLYVRSAEEEAQMGQDTAGRFSTGKIRFDLCAPWSMDQIAQVYTYGTIKYDDDNWWKGLKWKKDVLGCIFRHVWKWVRGEVLDDESGLHHLAHAAWNCIALMEYERCGIGIDDRVPYTLDLMDETERNRRIKLWKKYAKVDQMGKYNGIRTNCRRTKLKK
ncbi:MAG: dATP/dGTP diphosphohydrolase domain-containing protein [Candidatus Heimdallarchaeaceae archaeon]